MSKKANFLSFWMECRHRDSTKTMCGTCKLKAPHCNENACPLWKPDDLDFMLAERCCNIIVAAAPDPDNEAEPHIRYIIAEILTEDQKKDLYGLILWHDENANDRSLPEGWLGLNLAHDIFGIWDHQNDPTFLPRSNGYWERVGGE